MTALDMQGLYGAGIARIAQIHAFQRGRKLALELLTTLDEVQSFVVDFGWTN